MPLLDRDGVRIRYDRIGEGPVVVLSQHDDKVITSVTNLAVPHLVAVGAGDDPFLAAAEHLAATTPGREKVVVDGAGHASSIDQPDDVGEAVTGLLASLGR